MGAAEFDDPGARSPAPSLLVATVTVVFAGPLADATPEQVAASLLRHEDVSTVRIDDHGAASSYRVDVVGPVLEEAAERATALAEEVAGPLDLRAEVVSVGLMRDDDRTEVFRIGDRGEDLVWGERRSTAGSTEMQRSAER